MIYSLAFAAPLSYLGVLIMINLLGHTLVRRLVFAVGDTFFSATFSYKVGSWATLWLEAGSAWTVVMLAIIYAMRRWVPISETLFEKPTNDC